MRKKLFFILPILFIFLIAGYFIKTKFLQVKKVHYHAGFIVIKDNKQEDFTDIKYMHVKPCTSGDTEEHNTPEEEQQERAHLHDKVGDVVHVHREGVAWKELFSNIDYPINYADTTAYINDKKIDNFQNNLIAPYDSLVLFIGKDDNTEEFLKQAVTKKHIEEVESKSESCGKE